MRIKFPMGRCRDCPVPASLCKCGEPDDAVAYWRMHIETDPSFQPSTRGTMQYREIKTIKARTEHVLRTRPETRNSDAKLVELVCAQFHHAAGPFLVDRRKLVLVPLI